MLFLSQWVPSRHRTKILGLFYLAQPLTTVFGAPLAGWLIGRHGLFGLEGWRVMFLFVSLPAIVLGVVAWFYLIDKPADAKWLTPAERDWLTAELAAENARKTGHEGQHAKGDLKRAFTSGLGLACVVTSLVVTPVSPRFLCDDHQRLPGAVRHHVQRDGQGVDHGHPVPAGRRRPLLLDPARHPSRHPHCMCRTAVCAPLHHWPLSWLADRHGRGS
ncbi:MFS transporter [Streptomyces sp. DHE17-7]|uniref:MFS transporter n=1 Tax=Streptomyces sp. DHE17-7 TaxID=2759949 RepID=UPI0022EA38E2|nr:MFS transporter [Streptomyces sp. DHE17-7]